MTDIIIIAGFFPLGCRKSTINDRAGNFIRLLRVINTSGDGKIESLYTHSDKFSTSFLSIFTSFPALSFSLTILPFSCPCIPSPQPSFFTFSFHHFPSLPHKFPSHKFPSHFALPWFGHITAFVCVVRSLLTQTSISLADDICVGIDHSKKNICPRGRLLRVYTWFYVYLLTDIYCSYKMTCFYWWVNFARGRY